MRHGIREISKDVFDRAVSNHGYITREDELTVFSDSERLGYGLYGTHVFQENGRFYVRFTLGTTCD